MSVEEGIGMFKKRKGRAGKRNRSIGKTNVFVYETT
jgi:hypothetical protein